MKEAHGLNYKIVRYTILFILLPFICDAQALWRVIDHYEQGICTFGDTAYITAGHDEVSRFVMKIDLNTGDTIESLPFDATYDMTALIINKIDGTPIIIAREWANDRAKALYLDGSTAWEGDPDIIGLGQLGFQWYKPIDTTFIYYAEKGIRCINSENGRRVWWKWSFYEVGCAIDTANDLLYWQYQNIGGQNGQLSKIDALTGEVYDSVHVGVGTSGAWIPVYINDNYVSDKILTQWYTGSFFDCTIKLFDSDLNEVWSIGPENNDSLAFSYKSQFTYHEGTVYVPYGNGFIHPDGLPFASNKWRKIRAYNVTDGSLKWTCDLSADSTTMVQHMIVYNGFLYAFAESVPYDFRYYKIRLSDGAVLENNVYPYQVSACANPCISHGKLLIGGTGALKKTLIIKLNNCNNAQEQWQGAYGTQQGYMIQEKNSCNTKKIYK